MNPSTILLIGGCIAILFSLLTLWGLIRLIKSWRKPKPVPLTPEEQAETDKLRLLQAECGAAEITLKGLKSQHARWDAEIQNKQSSAKQIAQEVERQQARLKEAQTAVSEAVCTCHACKAETVGEVCNKCGAKQKRTTIPYVKTDWATVCTALHEVVEWGEPSEFQLDSGTVLLPWPTSDEVTFKVGGIEYEWGKMEDEDNGGNDWWAYLSYTHPILGDLKIINKINSDGDHLLRDDYSDDVELSGGDLSDVRSDLAKGIKQGITALYLWMESEKVS